MLHFLQFEQLLDFEVPKGSTLETFMQIIFVLQNGILAGERERVHHNSKHK